MDSLLIFSNRIEEILKSKDCDTQQRIFNVYTTLNNDESRDFFILALIGKILVLQTQLEIERKK